MIETFMHMAQSYATECTYGDRDAMRCVACYRFSLAAVLLTCNPHLLRDHGMGSCYRFTTSANGCSALRTFSLCALVIAMKLSSLTDQVIYSAVELGRAATARRDRNTSTGANDLV